jgi:hypothetical protein
VLGIDDLLLKIVLKLLLFSILSINYILLDCYLCTITYVYKLLKFVYYVFCIEK